MSEIRTLDDFTGRDAVIYGAGSTGHQCHMLLTGKAKDCKVLAFSDTFKTGVDVATRLNIVRPGDLAGFRNAVIVIGISDILKPEDAGEVERTLVSLGIEPANIVKHSRLLSMVSERFSESEFDWQRHMDDIYDFNTNIVLIKSLSAYIDESDACVVDLGAGNMNLRKFIPSSVRYIPVDFKRRSEETIVCDLNDGEFPDIEADVYVLCAMLYYMDKPLDLIEKCAKFASKKIIVAMNNRDMSQYPDAMRVHGFKSYLYFDEITPILAKYGFKAANDVTIQSVARRYIVYETGNG
jgi:hypothetical protein